MPLASLRPCLAPGCGALTDSGRCELHRKQREQAQEHLRTATTMYRDMDMQFWLERAETELKELG